MLERFNQFIHRFYITFINVLHVMTIPIVGLLSLASGFTTFKGMRRYITTGTEFVDILIALAITIAVQIIIILAAYELSNTYFRAHKFRFLSLLLSLVIAISVSINFSSIMFYDSSRAAAEKVEKFNKMDQEVKAYIAQVRKIKSEVTSEKRSHIEQLKGQSRQVLIGALPGLSTEPRRRWRRSVYVYEEINKSLSDERRDWADLEKRFDTEVEPQVKAFMANDWKQEISANPESYKNASQKFDELTDLIGNVLSKSTRETVNRPTIMLWETFTELSPPFAFTSSFPLVLAVIIDVLVFLFSWRLKTIPAGMMSREEKELAYYGIKQFTGHEINKNDRLQFRIKKTSREVDEDYDDKLRVNILSLLISKGYVRRVNRDYVELTARFDDVLAKKLTDELVTSQPSSDLAATSASPAPPPSPAPAVGD
jgi:hypothetical protein